jgi:peptidyl-prolyl cis-trans isomerase C
VELRRTRWGAVIPAVAAMAAGTCSGDRNAANRPPATTSAPPASRTSDPGAPPEIDRVTPLPSPLPEVAARVNGQPIVLRIVRLLAEQGAPPGKAPRTPEPGAYRQALQQAIVRELLFQEALKRNISADDARVEQAYNEARVRFKDDKAWAAMLAAQGMDPQAYRAELRVHQTIQKLLWQIADEAHAQATDQEAMAFYESHPAVFDAGEKVRASHILVRVPEGTAPARKEELRKKAEALLGRVRGGEDFAAVARKSSEDPGSAAKGGELGAFGRGQMVPAFEKAAFDLKAGEVSGVVESPFGFHIIKVSERLPARKVSFPEVKERLKQEMAQQKRQQAQQSFVNALRAKAKIETFL